MDSFAKNGWLENEEKMCRIDNNGLILSCNYKDYEQQFLFSFSPSLKYSDRCNNNKYL